MLKDSTGTDSMHVDRCCCHEIPIEIVSLCLSEFSHISYLVAASFSATLSLLTYILILSYVTSQSRITFPSFDSCIWQAAWRHFQTPIFVLKLGEWGAMWISLLHLHGSVCAYWARNWNDQDSLVREPPWRYLHHVISLSKICTPTCLDQHSLSSLLGR